MKFDMLNTSARNNTQKDFEFSYFDDIDGADCYAPPLTTVRQPFDRLGRAAVRIVCSMMHGGKSEDVTIDPELIIRSSSIE